MIKHMRWSAPIRGWTAAVHYSIGSTQPNDSWKGFGYLYFIAIALQKFEIKTRKKFK